MDIEAQIKKLGLKSALNVGRLVRQELRDDGAPSEASFGTYVLKLTKGERSWWLRAEAASARAIIARLLETTEEDLFPELFVVNPFAVSSWPQLRPFEPDRDRVFDVGVVSESPFHVGLGDVHTPTTGESPRRLPGLLEYVFSQQRDCPRWVVVPPGGGKSFALALARHHGLSTADVTYLSEVGVVDPSLPTIVRVAAMKGDEDALAAENLSACGKIVVLAEFSRPRMPDEGPSDDSERKKSNSVWQDATYRADPESRDAFLAWIGDRAGWEADLVARALAWFREIDAKAEATGTAGAMLWLGGRIDELGLRNCRELGLRGLFRQHIELTAQTIETTVPTSAEWLRQYGEQAYLGLLARRAASLADSGWYSATEHSWRDFVPNEPKPIEAVAEKLAAIAKEAREERRIALASALAKDMSTTRDADEVILRLRQARLLVPVGEQRLAAEPAWFVQSWFAGNLAAQMAAGDYSWGRLCFDTHRRDLIDRVLDEQLQLAGRLRFLVEIVIKAPRTSAAIGATEALFAAVARMLAIGTVPPTPMPLLVGLWEAQVRCGVTRYSGSSIAGPASRLHSPDVWRDGREWIENCWTWSFELARPEVEIPERFVWLFPGWSAPVVSSIPSEIHFSEPGGRCARYLLRMCLEQPDVAPADNSHHEFTIAFVAARILDGRSGLTRGQSPIWDRVVPLLGLGGEDDSPALDEIGRRLIRAVQLINNEGSGADSALYQLVYRDGPTRRVFTKFADSGLTAEVVQRSGVGLHGFLDNLLHLLPPATHLAALQACLAREVNPSAALMTQPDKLAQLAPDALQWLALHFCDNWVLVRAWTLRDPGAALKWLLETSCAKPTAGQAIAVLKRPYLLQVLDWIEALPPASRPRLTGSWAAFMLDRNPDLVDRLLPLLEWSIPGDDTDAIAGPSESDVAVS